VTVDATVRVEECRFRAGEDTAWDAYVSSCGEASYCHRAGWRRVIQRTYGHTPVYLWALDETGVRGVLPLVVFRGVLGARSVVSLPFLDEGGVCADRDDVRSALWEAAVDVSRHHRAGSIELRQREPSGLALDPAGSKVAVMLKLESDPDVMWKRLDGKVRNQVRKATSAGLSSAWCGIEGLDEFYGVFTTNMRDLGSPVHGRRFFATLLEEFADSTRLLLVRDGSRAVAGGVCTVFGDTVIVPWASSLREWRSRCPSNLLYWEVIRSACEKRLRWLDFGRSSLGSGTYRFKMQWGGLERPLHWERFGRSDSQSPAGADDARYAWAVSAWQRLPVAVATMLGPLLRRHLSN
jgi:FemAB-related protein (PEP-CTERM system-associated)